MKLPVDALETLTPLHVAGYLRTRGWNEVQRLGEQAVIFEKAAENDQVGAEALVPLDPNLGDFYRRLADVLATLERVESRPREEIADDIRSVLADSIRIRLAGPTLEGPTISIEQAVDVVAHARLLLLAAACAAVEPKRVYPTRRPDIVIGFGARILLAPPANGSYVLTLRSPVPDVPSDLWGDDYEPPFGRRAIGALGRALTAANRVALAMSSPSDEVAHGVSANLCEAIYGLVDSSKARHMDVSIAAAPARPTFLPQRVTFTSEGAAILGEVARNFRATAPREDFVLEGVVVKLENTSVSVGAPGEAVLAALVEGAMKRVSVELEANEYARVVEAHRLGRIVRMHGELSKVRRSWVLKSPRSLRVIDPDVDEVE